MASTVRQFFVAQAINLMEGRLDAVARAHSVPLVVALPDVDPGFVVLSSRSEVEYFFRLKLAGLKQAGITSLQAHVLSTRATARGRVTAAVDWLYVSNGRQVGQTSARYFIERRRGALSVHMIEFVRLAMPSIVAWFREAGQLAHSLPGGRLH